MEFEKNDNNPYRSLKESYTYTLKLTNPYSIVSLPVIMSNVNKMRIKSLRYVTANTGNEFLIVHISGWDNNNTYFDGEKNINYTKFMNLSNTTLTLNLYENNDNNWHDVVLKHDVGSISNFHIKLLINGEFNNEISPSNPIYIEIYVS